MSGVDFISNISLGAIGQLAEDTPTTFRLLLLQATGLESDAVLRDYDTVAAILAASNTEATFTNYARQTLANVARVVNDTDNRVEVDADDVTWSAAGGTLDNTLAKAIIFVGALTGDDANARPLGGWSFDATTDGNDLIAQISDFFRAVSAA